ncbi:MAG: hypothetical protein JM58_12390 [Peptococcaceae bacterium BICA1-8]|nr:MAG: hypothetical protein JM58_12390 [Peptococcaceae bacterium BICA1-8]
MDVIKNALEKMGYSAKDGYEMPDSLYRFPDGAHYRNEVAGIENVKVLEAMIDESEKRNVPIHRIIATVGGATVLTNSELKELAQIAAEKKYEVIMNPYCSRAWDGGRQYATPEGYVSGMRIRGADNFYYVLKDMERCIEAGIRGFLVTDEGMLSVVSQLRDSGVFPKDIIFKVSVFAGHGSPAGAKLLKSLGANTFNPLADLTLPMLASIRKVVDMPMDVYTTLVDSMGGFNRMIEAAEIARICAPIYLKFEPGKSEGDIYKTWVEPDYLCFLAREKVRQVQTTMEWVERFNSTLKCSAVGPADLAIPKA